MEIIKRPHDKFFKETLSDLETAQDFIRNYLPQELLELIDIETLTLDKNDYITPEMQEFYSDILFKTMINGQEGYLYFLAEHKSYRSPKIALQLLRYMISIWEQKAKEKESPLPIIIPFVLYHGKDKWNIPQNLSSLMGNCEGLTDKLKCFIPDYQYLLCDLSPHGSEEIKGSLKLQIFLEILASIFHKDYEQFALTIEKSLISLDQLSKHSRENPDLVFNYLQTTVLYIMSVREDITMEDILKISKSISIEGREKVMTLAERLMQEGKLEGIQEGRQEGMQEGRQEEKRKTAKKLLKMGLSLSEVAEATELAIIEVEQINREMTI